MHEPMRRVDLEHSAALDILLLLADAEARWNNHARALDLLTEAEQAGCRLSAEYQLKRRAWDAVLAN